MVDRRMGFVGSFTVASIVVAVVVGACGTEERVGSATAVRDSCPVGDRRPVFPDLESKFRSESVVLGCAELRDDRQVTLLSDVQASGLCLQIVGLDDHVRECGNAPSAVVPSINRPISGQAIAQLNRAAPLEVYGATSPEVAIVEAEYRLQGSRHHLRAELIPVTDPEALGKAGIREPFGYFLAELPAKAAKVEVVALDSGGETLGSDDVRRFLGSPRRFVSGSIR